MVALKVVLTILFLLVCVALVALVLFQEGKSAGLSGALSGGSETFWSKNKSRSVEGKLENITKILGAAFIVLAIVLNLF
ncbi:MAG: preprotein translocase subunit SecG [Lachnospiraceae bacterium]|nr:preprotein translocase subunit SecG [Lachnospiraceae bacterium]